MGILEEAAGHLSKLGEANRAFTDVYPGDSPARQPVHTVYGGAQLFKADTPRRLGELALRSMEAYGRDPLEFAAGVGFAAPKAGTTEKDLRAAFERDAEALRKSDPNGWLALMVYDRVRTKLAREATEDFRVDFEDGFGARPDAEEATSSPTRRCTSTPPGFHPS